MRIVFATGNDGKMREIRDIMSDADAGIVSMKELGIVSSAEENGDTFAQNAMIKVNQVYGILKDRGEMEDTIVMADDSGICIDYFDGGPGVRSARFLGHDTPYMYKNKVILEMMEGVPEEKRGARFVCHIAAVDENGRVYNAEGALAGRIAFEIRGREGFGYDPIFYLPDRGCTSGELSEEEKNKISHRGKVLRMMKDILGDAGLLKLKANND